MISLEQIQEIEFELSSYCNASCPLCPRNLFGHNRDLGYIKTHLTPKQIQSIVQPIAPQLNKVIFEGNFGDPLANPDIEKIIDLFDTPITICTNGYFRNKVFWENLAQKNVTVKFGIDGVDKQTHERYRRGTNFDRIILNAKNFINSGGTAVWKMIKFDFNTHQIEQAKLLSQSLGFARFELVDHGRNNGPVFDDAGNLVDVLGNFQGSVDLEHYNSLVDHGEMLLEDIDIPCVDTIKCYSKKHKSIYVSSTGDVYPCCFMGFAPAHYGNGRWHQPVNNQLIPLIKENNALVHGLEHALKWFDNISLTPGDLVVCDSSCGHNQ